MTVTQITSLMLSYLDDEQAGYFNASDTFQWINLAQRQVQMYLLEAGANYYMRPVETNFIIGQSDYLLPADFMILHRFEYVISGTGTQENRQPLTPMTTNQQDLVSIVQGPPTNYYIKKDRVTVMPTPDQGYLARLYYSPRTADLQNLTDVPDVPEQYMEFLALLATFDGFIKDDRAPDNLIAKKALYERTLERMAAERTQDLARQVVMVNEYDVGAWY